jgi:hypothetical protein
METQMEDNYSKASYNISISEPEQSSLIEYGTCDSAGCTSKGTERIELEGFTVFIFCAKCAQIFRENDE